MSDVDPDEKKVASYNGEKNIWQKIKDNCTIQ